MKLILRSNYDIIDEEISQDLGNNFLTLQFEPGYLSQKTLRDPILPSPLSLSKEKRRTFCSFYVCE